MIALWLALAVAGGVVIGVFAGVRLMPFMLARMSESDMDALADRVREIKHDGTS